MCLRKAGISSNSRRQLIHLVETVIFVILCTQLALRVLINQNVVLNIWLKHCFTSTETVGLLGMGAQDSHLDFHPAPELCVFNNSKLLMSGHFCLSHRELVSLLQSRNTAVYLISGGFRRLIEPAAQHLNIPLENIFANRLLFENGGQFPLEHCSQFIG